MSHFAVIRHGLPVLGGGGGSVPTINYVTANGTKRQGEVVWLEIEDDGTANKFKFDVQVGGVSLTSVTINDNGVTGAQNFPYQTTSPAISFNVPASLNDTANYSITGTASRDSGASYATPVAAEEDYGATNGTFFTAPTRSISASRTTTSGFTPMQVTVAGDLYDSDNLRIDHFNASNALIETSVVPLTEVDLTTPFTIDLSGTSDPAPSPALTAGSATDYYIFKATSGDYVEGAGLVVLAGVASSGVSVSVTDGPVTWNTGDTASGNVFSNGNLTVTGNLGGSHWVRAGKAVQPGQKKYWELSPSSQDLIGVLDGAFTLTAFGGFGAESPDACVFDSNDGFICYGSGHVAASPGTIAGHRVGVLVDYTGAHPVVTFTVDNVAASAPITMSSVTTAVYPGVSPSNGQNIIARFASSDLTYSLPSGASVL